MFSRRRRRAIDRRIQAHIDELGPTTTSVLAHVDLDTMNDEEAELVLARFDRMKRARDRAARMRFAVSGTFEYEHKE